MSKYLSLLDIQMKQISESTNEWGASENKGLLRVQISVAPNSWNYPPWIVRECLSRFWCHLPQSYIQQTMISRKQRTLNTLQNELVNNSKIIQETVSGIPDFSQLSPLNPKVHLHVEPSHFPPFLHSPQPLLKTADKIWIKIARAKMQCGFIPI